MAIGNDSLEKRIADLENEVLRLKEALRRMGGYRTNYHFALLLKTQPELFVVEADKSAWMARCEAETQKILGELLA
jgi:hypothetical protein